MIDRYTKGVLTIIAVSLACIAGELVLRHVVSDAQAQSIVRVRVVDVENTLDVRVRGGKLDYETDVSSGPTLKVCTNC
jgi:hypothetical protein